MLGGPGGQLAKALLVDPDQTRGQVLDALVKQGANQINGPMLEVESPQAAQDKARLDAIKTLQARAALYAKATGLQVKRVISISESVDYSPMPMPMARWPPSVRAGAWAASTSRRFRPT